MAAMNWERMNTLKHGTAYAYDELPPAGSCWDRARYFSKGDAARRCHVTPVRAQRDQPDNEFTRRIKGIEPVVQYIQTKAFRKRPAEDRRKLVTSLTETIQKFAQAPDAALYLSHPVVRKAAQICQIHH